MLKKGSWKEICTEDDAGNIELRLVGTCCNCSADVLIELEGTVFDYLCDNCGTMGSGTVEPLG